MRKMTEEQATLYIKAGYFPRTTDIEAIVDLQDVYGHQNYWAIIRWLYNTDTCDNAKKLFYLIWHKDDVNRYIETANAIKEKERELAKLRANIAELKREEAKLADELAKERFAMSLGLAEENNV